jgi:hypothetical protein
MAEQPATITPKDEKHSAFLPGLIVWPVVILLLYVLSSGPVMMMAVKGRIDPQNKFFMIFYSPIGWAYNKTSLHKPLGMYMHFWAPQILNKKGDFSPVSSVN